jgi:hypothetical protein
LRLIDPARLDQMTIDESSVKNLVSGRFELGG